MSHVARPMEHTRFGKLLEVQNKTAAVAWLPHAQQFQEAALTTLLASWAILQIETEPIGL